MTQSFTVIFGLTADPIHLGHEQAIINGIKFLREKGFEVEQFCLIPVFKPHLIGDKRTPKASFEQRYNMCELVAKRLSQELNCSIVVSSIEKELAETTGEKNYSFNTIRAIKQDLSCLGEWIPACAGMTKKLTGMTKEAAGMTRASGGKTNLLFMVSADHFCGRWPKFRQWYKWREVLEYSGLLINQRPGNKINQQFIKQLRQINPAVYIVNNPNIINVSSSEIRQKVGTAQTDGLLASDISAYIIAQRLYH